MFNYYKMELYRFLKTKSYWLLTLALFLIVGISAFTVIPEDIDISSAIDGVKVVTNQIDLSNTLLVKTRIDELVLIFSGNLIQMFTAIVSCLFCGALVQYRFEKNVIFNSQSRFYILGADFCVGAIYSFLVMAGLVCLDGGVKLLVNPVFQQLPVGNVLLFLRFFVIFFLYIMVLWAAVALFIQLLNHQLIGIVLCLIYFSGIPYGMANYLLGSLGLHQKVEPFLPLGRTLLLATQYQTFNFWHWALYGIVALALIFACHLWLVNHQDIQV